VLTSHVSPSTLHPRHVSYIRSPHRPYGPCPATITTAKAREIGRIPPTCVEGLSLEERLRLFRCFTVSATGHASHPYAECGKAQSAQTPTAQAAQVTGAILPAKPNGTVPTVVAFGRDPHQRWRNCCRRPTPLRDGTVLYGIYQLGLNTAVATAEMRTARPPSTPTVPIHFLTCKAFCSSPHRRGNLKMPQSWL
jgi:hypothetical protein